MKTYSSCYVNGMMMFVDLTPQLGVFSPSILIYFANLQELDISGCNSIDPEMFIDCLVACKFLKKLVMVRCTQFTQHQVVKMVQNIRAVTYLDASECCMVNYVNASTFWPHYQIWKLSI